MKKNLNWPWSGSLPTSGESALDTDVERATSFFNHAVRQNEAANAAAAGVDYRKSTNFHDVAVGGLHLADGRLWRELDSLAREVAELRARLEELEGRRR